MAGHGSDPPSDQANNPNRQVSRPATTAPGVGSNNVNEPIFGGVGSYMQHETQEYTG